MRFATLCFVALLGYSGLPAFAQTVTTITEPFEASGGVSVGPDGNIYVADFGRFLNQNGGTNVYRVTPEGEIEVFATGLVGASGNAFDAEGNLFQSNIGAGRISKITPDGTVTMYATDGISAPVGVAVDPDGNVYNTNCQSPGRISKTTPDGTTTTLASSALMSCPNGLTIDNDGNLYTANFNDGRIVKITPDGTASVLVNVNTSSGNGHLTFANGRLYVANWSGRIYEVLLDGTSRVFAGTGNGLADGPADQAQFFRPNGISASVTGDTLYLNHTAQIVALPQIHLNTVRMITGVLATIVDTEDEAAVDGDLGLAPSVPNPFRSLTRIAYTLPRPMTVSLRVYDVLGRSVRTLVARAESAGTHEVQWDGRSDAGHRLASGVYLYALDGAAQRVVRRTTLLD